MSDVKSLIVPIPVDWVAKWQNNILQGESVNNQDLSSDVIVMSLMEPTTQGWSVKKYVFCFSSNSQTTWPPEWRSKKDYVGSTKDVQRKEEDFSQQIRHAGWQTAVQSAVEYIGVYGAESTSMRTNTIYE